MKEYPKIYEDMYRRPKVLEKCTIENVTVQDGTSVVEYRNFFRKNLFVIMEQLFDADVRFVWMQSKYVYKGKRRKKTCRNSPVVDGSFGVFMRHYIGIDYRIFSRSFHYTKIVSYFKDFFPEFYERNPFEDPEYYKYPYKFITFDYLTIVEKMPQRLELLKIAEERKLLWDEFFDYVVNFFSCYNDEMGKDVFSVVSPVSTCPPYIKNNLEKHQSGHNRPELLIL